jgi:hypothetical protein
MFFSRWIGVFIRIGFGSKIIAFFPIAGKVVNDMLVIERRPPAEISYAALMGFVHRASAAS